MPDVTDKHDLGRAHGTQPDRGAPSGHTPEDHAEHRRALRPRRGPDHADPTEKARPRDSSRSGA